MLDGGKLLLRLNLQDRDAAPTLMYAAETVNRLSALGLPTFLEPLLVERAASGSWQVLRTAEALMPLLGVASALGSSSAHTWLKLPMVAEMGRAARATTLPILLLGGDSAGEPEKVLHSIQEACQAAPNVRGLMIGRSVLFAGAGIDPQSMAVAAARVARGRWSATEAAASLSREVQP